MDEYIFVLFYRISSTLGTIFRQPYNNDHISCIFLFDLKPIYSAPNASYMKIEDNKTHIPN